MKAFFTMVVSVGLFLITSSSNLYGEYYYAFKHLDYANVFSALAKEPMTFRREKGIQILKENSLNSQRELLTFLDSLKLAGDVSSVKSFWIADIVMFESNSFVAELVKKRFFDRLVIVAYEDTAILAVPSDTSWAIGHLGFPDATRIFGVNGDGVVVGVFDTGISKWVRQFIGKVWENFNEVFDYADNDSNGYVDDIWGYNFYDTTSHPYDDRGHGTFVSGEIVAWDDYLCGSATNAKIAALKTLNSSGTGLPSMVWEAIQYALENNISVGNFSIGWRYLTDTLGYRNMWRDVMVDAIELGMVAVVAAGNEGASIGVPNNLRTPGDVPEVITVGATLENDSIAPLSSIGPVQWNRFPWDDFPYPPGLLKPDIVAPGVSVPSVVITGGFEQWSGTSMSTPLVSATCALMRQWDPEISHYEIKEILEQTAIDLGDSGKDSIYGSGLLNPVDAMWEIARRRGYGWVNFRCDTPGTIVVIPRKLKWVIDDEIVVPVPLGEQIAVFHDRSIVDTLAFTPVPGETTIVVFSTGEIPLRSVRIGVMDFDDGEPLSAFAIVNSETILVNQFCWLDIIPLEPVEISVTAEGYSMSIDTVLPEHQCVFCFLHRGFDFEDSSIFFRTGDWQWGTPSTGPACSRSGEKLYATALEDTYSNSSDSWLISPPFFADTSACVFLWQWFDCEATHWGFWDGGNLSCSTKTDTQWRILFPVGDYPCWLDDYNSIMSWQPAFSGTLTGNFWHQKVFPLMLEAPETVWFALHFSSDDNTTRTGWYVDDFCFASRTIREPIIKLARTNADSVWLATWAVDGEIVSVRVCNEMGHCVDAIPISCDTFFANVPGMPGDTVLWFALAEDNRGLVARIPQSGFFTAVIPAGYITDGVPYIWNFVVKVQSDRVDIQSARIVKIYDFLGRIVATLPPGRIVWRPPAPGMYIVRSGASAKKVLIAE